MFRNEAVQKWPNNAQKEENENTVDWYHSNTMQIGTDSKLVHKFQKSSLLKACIDTLRNVEKVIYISRLFFK